jgi:hypothetical protein
MTDTTSSSAPSTWHEVAPARVPDNVHVVGHGQTLPMIAELLGHPGEWMALFHHNVPAESRDKISPDALPVGAWLEVPPEWRAGDAKPDAKAAAAAAKAADTDAKPQTDTSGAEVETEATWNDRNARRSQGKS